MCVQSCLTVCGPMDCNLPGSSVQGIFSGKNTGVGCHFLLQVHVLPKLKTKLKIIKVIIKKSHPSNQV